MHLHAEASTYRRVYTQTHLHTEAFTQRSFTHRNCHTQTRLHRGAFTQGHLHTQKLLHREPLPQRTFVGLQSAILQQFLMSDFKFVRKGCIWSFKIAILPQVSTFDLIQLHFYYSFSCFTTSFAVRPFRFVWKGCIWSFNRLLVVDIWPSCRAKGRRRATKKLHFTTR